MKATHKATGKVFDLRWEYGNLIDCETLCCVIRDEFTILLADMDKEERDTLVTYIEGLVDVVIPDDAHALVAVFGVNGRVCLSSTVKSGADLCAVLRGVARAIDERN